MAEKTTRPARWWLNTYFLFGFALLFLGILGLVKGVDSIRDPGQPDNASLALWYLAAAGLFLLNGYVSHKAHTETVEEGND